MVCVISYFILKNFSRFMNFNAGSIKFKQLVLFELSMTSFSASAANESIDCWSLWLIAILSA